jgi:hypothetical protein
MNHNTPPTPTTENPDIALSFAESPIPGHPLTMKVIRCWGEYLENERRKLTNPRIAPGNDDPSAEYIRYLSEKSRCKMLRRGGIRKEFHRTAVE